MQCDYYSLLGVDRFASQDALRRAYRCRVLAAHPDRNPNNPVACERTRELIEAYHVLCNPMSRRVYDLAIFQPVEPRYIVTRPCHREFGCPQWVTMLCVVLIFLGIVGGVACGVRSYLDSRTIVFRPQLGAINVSPVPASPALLGKRIIAPIANVAHEDRFGLASNVVSRVCLQTAVCAEKETRSGIQLFATVAPPASL